MAKKESSERAIESHQSSIGLVLGFHLLVLLVVLFEGFLILLQIVFIGFRLILVVRSSILLIGRGVFFVIVMMMMLENSLNERLLALHRMLRLCWALVSHTRTLEVTH